MVESNGFITKLKTKWICAPVILLFISIKNNWADFEEIIALQCSLQHIHHRQGMETTYMVTDGWMAKENVYTYMKYCSAL
jgi:hypothetical protein